MLIMPLFIMNRFKKFWLDTFLIRMFILGLIIFDVIMIYGKHVIEWMNDTLKNIMN